METEREQQHSNSALSYRLPTRWLVLFGVLVCLLAAWYFTSLSRTDAQQTQALYLFDHRAQYAGNADDIAALAQALPLPLPSTVRFDHITVESVVEPYTLAVHYRLQAEGDGANEGELIKNSAVLLALIENTDVIVHQGKTEAATKYFYTYAHSRARVEKVLDVDLATAGQNEDELAVMLNYLYGTEDDPSVFSKRATELGLWLEEYCRLYELDAEQAEPLLADFAVWLSVFAGRWCAADALATLAYAELSVDKATATLTFCDADGASVAAFTRTPNGQITAK